MDGEAVREKDHSSGRQVSILEDGVVNQPGFFRQFNLCSPFYGEQVHGCGKSSQGYSGRQFPVLPDVFHDL
jgi:hypothetical protein